MVLALPILLFVMALMVNYDTVASWKVRALSIARNEVWSTRWPRNGSAMPRPDYWPQTAGMAYAGIGSIPSLDDPRVDLPVARGPLPGVTVKQTLDPTQGFRQGTADMQREYPLLSKVGPYSLHAQTEFLDNLWQYGQMGLSSNYQPRIPVLYVLPQGDPSLVQGYVTAAMAVVDANQQPGLAPLQHDPDFIKYRGSAPNFQPQLPVCSCPGCGGCPPGFCSLSRDDAQAVVQNLIDRIQGRKDPKVASVAEVMTGAFIGLYQWEINQLQQSSQDNSALIAQFQNDIQILQQFLATL
jgi:hypothetical protein